MCAARANLEDNHQGEADIYPDNAAVQEIEEQNNLSVGCSSSTSSQDSAAKIKEEEAEIDFGSKESQVLEHRSTEPIPAERDNISDEEIDDLLKSDDEDDLTQSSTSIKVRQTGKEDGDALGEVFVSLAMDDDDSAGIVKNKQRKKAEKAKKDKDKWSQLYFMSNRGGQKCKV